MNVGAQSGRCLCGACAFTAASVKPETHACHCGMCRRWTGGPEYGVDCAGVSFVEDAPIGRWRSSEWAERGFCARCGGALFYRLIDAPEGEMSMVPGVFDDQTQFELVREIFVDERPAWVPVAPVAQLTGAEALASFGAQG